MISLEQARRDLTELVKEINSAMRRGDITSREAAVLSNMRGNSGLCGALIRLADEWRKIELILDSLPPEPDSPEPLLASDAEIKEALKLS